MAEFDYIGLYQERLTNPDCYIQWQGDVAEKVNIKLEALGIPVEGPPDQAEIAHGLIDFGCFGESEEIHCVPWLVASDAERGVEDRGRHPIVATEFMATMIGGHGLREVREHGLKGIGTYNVHAGERYLSIIRTLRRYDIKNKSDRIGILARITDLSKKLNSLEFCIEDSSSQDWILVHDGEVIVGSQQ